MRPVFKWSPNWADGVRERISWDTTIDVSRDGTERRHRMRADTRTVIGYQTLVHGDEYQEFSMMLQAHQADEWLMPVWWDPSALTAADANGVAFDASGRDFSRPGEFSWAVLVRPVTGELVPVEIAIIGSNVWALKDPIDPLDFPVGTKIYPARVVELSPAQALSHVTAGVTTFGVEARVVDNRNHPPAADPSHLEYLEPNRIRPVEAGFERMGSMVDFGVGQFGFDDYAGQSFRTTVYDYLCIDRYELRDIRRALSYLQGRLGSLRLPTFQADLRAMSGSYSPGQPELFAGPISYKSVYENGVDGLLMKHLSTPLVSKIVTVSDVDDNSADDIYIDIGSGSGFTYKKDEVKISLVYTSRLTSDTVEINHTTTEVSEVSIGYRGLK